MAEHKKDYFEESEFLARFRVWKSTRAGIHGHNQKEEGSFKKGLNQYSDLTDSEFKERHLGYKHNPQRVRKERYLEAEILKD